MISKSGVHAVSVIPKPGPRQSNAIKVRTRIRFPATIAELKCTRKSCETGKEKLMIQIFIIIIHYNYYYCYNHHHPGGSHYVAAVEIGFGSLFLFFYLLLPCIYQFVFIIEMDCFN